MMEAGLQLDVDVSTGVDVGELQPIVRGAVRR
jgi:hypothetical protein